MRRGAFTGAVGNKVGLFESANGGTLFLDEIGELGQAVQVKLLRVMQDHEVRRVGSTTSMRVDVRIIAATNRDLEQLVKAGKYRDDLFYRLNVVRIILPPLVERREDIPMLVHHFLQKCAAGAAHAVRGVLPETMTLLMQYRWPGNVRELENAIERAVSLSHGPLLSRTICRRRCVGRSCRQRRPPGRSATAMRDVCRLKRSKNAISPAC